VFANSLQPGPVKIAAYIRWSTDEQGSGTTLAIQRERLQKFVESQGWELRDELTFVDDGCTGASLERPALARLRDAVQAGQVDCVVVYKLDRLSRSLLDTVNLVRREWAGKAVLISATEHFDTASPLGQMIFNLLVSFAEFERSLIRERTLAGKRQRARQGRNAGQRYPFGYRRADGGGWSLEGYDEAAGRLTGPAATVRRIFENFLGGLSLSAVARLLNGEGVPSPGGSVWRFGYVARILDNPCYAGIYSYGEVEPSAVGAIPPLVSPEEWEAVRRRRGGAAGGERRAPRGNYLLSGLARCGRCGSPLAGSQGKTRRYYVCMGRVQRRSCDCAAMDADSLEAHVVGELLGALPPPASGALALRLQAVVAERTRVLHGALALAAREARRNRRLEEQFLQGEVDARRYAELAQRAEQAVIAAEGAVDSARKALAAAERGASANGQVRPCDGWAALALEEKRRLLREGVERLTAHRGSLLEVHITCRPSVGATRLLEEGCLRQILQELAEPPHNK